MPTLSTDRELPQNAASQGSAWYIEAMEHLVGVVQALSQARDVATITRIARDAARELTGADGATFVLRDGDKCYYADENAIAPLWKGMRFPLEMCVSGWVMLNAKSVTIPDIYDDPRVPADAYRPTFVKSLAMVPIRTESPIGAIGNYWAYNYEPTAEQMKVLQALADTTSVALENARLIEDLRDKVETLESQAVRIRAQHESLEVFTHALAHDLKEPVRTVRAFSDLIAGDLTGVSATTQTYFDFIRRAAERMGMLVDTVFTYSQLHDPSRLKKAECDMEAALAAVKENLTQLVGEHHAHIRSTGLPTVSAQPTHMMQVLQNLVSNAIRHSPDDVDIAVSAENRGTEWLFTVADNGPGIAPEDLTRIFLPFKRLNLNEEGAGLGLSICSKIIALHGGRIWCESVPGKGARFHFTLPVTDAGALPAPVTRNIMAANDTSLARVLLVDDREADIELTRVLLRDRDKMECELSVARGGKEALGILKQAQADGNPFDLVLLDINMPGMDGFETLEAIHREAHPAAVVMCTGSTYDRDMETAKDLGAVGYMVKPASAAQLKPMVEDIPGLSWNHEGVTLRLMRVA